MNLMLIGDCPNKTRFFLIGLRKYVDYLISSHVPKSFAEAPEKKHLTRRSHFFTSSQTIAKANLVKNQKTRINKIHLAIYLSYF